MTTFDIDIRVRTKEEGDGLPKANDGLKRLKAAFKSLATGAVVALATAALAKFGKEAINLASDVQEMKSKFNIVFSNFGSEVTAKLDEFSEAAGRSKTELQGMASTLGDTLKPLGFTEEKAADFSVQLTQLAVDLSSFNNIPMDDALRRLQGTLVGAHENALAFGVVINENTLKAELAANGWDKLTGKQFEAAKVQARINILMQGTTDAQGDAIRTSDSYANKQKALAAAFEELQIAIGEGLLPAMTESATTTERLVSVSSDYFRLANKLRDEVEKGNITYEGRERVLQRVLFTSATAAEVEEQLADIVAESQSKILSQTAAIEAGEIALADLTETVLENLEAQELAAIAADEQAAKLLFLTNVTEASKDPVDEVAVSWQDLEAIQNQNIITDELLAAASQKLAEETVRLAEESGDLFTRFAEGNQVTETMGATLIRMADAGGASAEAIALVAIATGEMSAAEADALIKKVALEQALASLGAEYATGDLTLQQYMDSANKAVIEIQNMTTAATDAETQTSELGASAMQTAELMAIEKNQALELAESLSEIPRDVNSNVKVSGIDDALGKSRQLQQLLRGLSAAGDVSAAIAAGEARDAGNNVGLAEGGSFTIPSGFPNDSFPLAPGIRAQSGEKITVTPAGKSGGGTTIGTVNVNVQSFPGANGAMQGQQAGSEFLNQIGGA